MGARGNVKIWIEDGGQNLIVNDSGTERTVTPELLGTIAQLTASQSELNQYAIQVSIPDISSADSVFVVAPHGGTITTWYSTIDNAITTADATLSLEIGGVAVTNSSITVAQSGSAAGDVDSASPTAANTVAAGGAIEVITDGGSSTACRATCTIVITR